MLSTDGDACANRGDDLAPVLYAVLGDASSEERQLCLGVSKK